MRKNPLKIKIASIFITNLYALYIFSRSTHDYNWDRAMYHDYIYKAWTNGWLETDWQAAGINTWLNPIGEFPIHLLQLIFNQYLGRLLLACLILNITFLILIRIYTIIFPEEQNHSAYILSAASILCAPYFLSELGTTFQNSLTTPLVLASITSILKCNDSGEKRNQILSGFLIGFAVAIKYTNVIYLIALLPVLQYLKLGFKKFLVGFCVGSCQLAIWSIYVFHSTKSPIFPFYNQFFRSPFYPDVNFRDQRWVFSGVESLITLVSANLFGRPISELKAIEIPISLNIILIFLGLLTFLKNKITNNSKKYGKKANAILLWYWISFTMWAILFFYSRYLIPVEVISVILLVLLISRLDFKDKIPNLKFAKYLIFIIVTLQLLSPVPNWTAASANSNYLNNGRAWDSDFSEAFSELNGVVLVMGQPVSYARELNSNVTNMVRIDFWKTPSKFKKIALTAYKSKKLNAIVVSTDSVNEDLGTEINEKILSNLGFESQKNWSCASFKGTIAVTYFICK